MKQALIVVIISAFIFVPYIAAARSYKPHASHLHKHRIPQGGHYIGGHGSSHKYGKYENPRTGSHYEQH